MNYKREINFRISKCLRYVGSIYLETKAMPIPCLKNPNQVLRELEDEKRKHEHDTAQGDDITYGLEKERTRLREVLN